jgi:hypothetical protein
LHSGWSVMITASPICTSPSAIARGRIASSPASNSPPPTVGRRLPPHLGRRAHPLHWSRYGMQELQEMQEFLPGV